MLELREAASILIDDFKHWDEVSYPAYLEDVGEKPQTKETVPSQDKSVKRRPEKVVGYGEEGTHGRRSCK